MTDREVFMMRNWDRLIVQPHDEWHVNLECDLDWQMLPVAGVLSDEQKEAVRKAYAPKLAKVAEKKLSDMRAMLDRIDSGKASLGYTTQNQEWLALRELHERYEFNCFQLKVFKEKYGMEVTE